MLERVDKVLLWPAETGFEQLTHRTIQKYKDLSAVTSM